MADQGTRLETEDDVRRALQMPFGRGPRTIAGCQRGAAGCRGRLPAAFSADSSPANANLHGLRRRLRMANRFASAKIGL